ncbi:MAG: hypothetical protein HOK30_11690 [Rhodospirillaceae bacterium]|jgi:hypothetical protein|nr:hypothetical protein [Rhodospirillaceae bacterium]MBT6428317.1 hypothetical protein [Rhodospirillaceae bacterium]
MTDYWLSKMFYDLQAPAASARWREDRTAILDDYPLSPEMRQAVLDDDIGAMAPHVNAYLLRFYCLVCGMEDTEFIAHLRALKPEEARNG